MNPPSTRVGFVSTRLAGTDGVSLETEKWTSVLDGHGHEAFFYAGECDREAARSYIVPEAHFTHPEIVTLQRKLISLDTRAPETTAEVTRLKDHLKDHLGKFVGQFNIGVLIVQNALALPLNIPLGLALTEFIAETGIPVIAHHHDFTWERKRFLVNAAGDYLKAAFPPVLPSVRHVVINSLARQQLALRTGLNSVLIPNVMDFNAPQSIDDYAQDLRAALGMGSEPILLQPTRVVPRKRIEVALDLARRLPLDCALLISHASGDEGGEYLRFLETQADLIGIRMIFASSLFSHTRGTTPDGGKLYSLADAYQAASLVTYPSAIEGFGNAFVETVLYRRPIVVNTYDVFIADIQPRGFRVIAFDDFIDEATVRQAERCLKDPGYVEEMVEHNFELGRRYYSIQVLEESLLPLLKECLAA